MSAPLRDPAALRPQPSRDGTEFHPTPDCLIAAAINHVLPTLPQAPTIWECAAGDGRLARAIAATGRTVIATDLTPRSPDVLVRCFITGAVPPGCPLAITNPPHSDKLQTPFMVRGLQLLDRGEISGLTLLFRLDHLMAVERAYAFNRAAHLLHCSWRARWILGTKTQPRWTYLWGTWLPGHTGPPVVRFLRPAHRRGDLLGDQDNNVTGETL
jgi:hypothetical protein